MTLKHFQMIPVPTWQFILLPLTTVAIIWKSFYGIKIHIKMNHFRLTSKAEFLGQKPVDLFWISLHEVCVKSLSFVLCFWWWRDGPLVPPVQGGELPPFEGITIHQDIEVWHPDPKFVVFFQNDGCQIGFQGPAWHNFVLYVQFKIKACII